MAVDHPAGDPQLVPLGLHVDPGPVRLARSAVRRQTRVRADDVGVIAQHRLGAGRRQNAPVSTTVATVHRRHRLGM